MFDIKTLGYLRNLVNEQLRRQDCECLSEEKLQSLKCDLDRAIDGTYVRKLIKHIEDAMPGDDLNGEALDNAMDGFCAKKFTIGFDGMSITSCVYPELYDGVLQLLQDHYDDWYANEGMTYALRQRLSNVKRQLDFIAKHCGDPENLDRVVNSQYTVQGIMSDIIDNLISLL
ncbi:hypothetical protein [Hymenobacter terricola]|uniref:hypothetical protein n=1 Tax=Hymenobacter terricola TaxID=2819236 RepID=UPI001B30505A|nr:hypothetical protein [Hymenobacter terricola]